MVPRQTSARTSRRLVRSKLDSVGPRGRVASPALFSSPRGGAGAP